MEIRKINNRLWKFVDSEIGEFSPSKFTINRLNDVITIVYFNNLKSKDYNVSDCYIFDIGDISGFNTSDGDDFMAKLEELNCPCFQKDETTVINPPIDISGKLDKSTTPSRVYGTDVSGNQDMIPVSEFKDVIFGYFNGTNFYTDAGFTNLITPESGKIYVNIAVTPAAQYRWSGSAYVQIGGASENFQQSTWMFSDFYSDNVYQPPFTGGALGGGSKDSAVYSSSTQEYLGAFLLSSGTTANGGYRVLDTFNAGFGGFRPDSDLTFYGVFSLISQSDARDRIIRIGFHNAPNHFAPVHGCFLEILGSTAYFKTRKDNVETSSSGVALTSNVYHKLLIEFISTTSVNCKLVDSSGNVVLNVNHTTNIPSVGNRFGCGLTATITTAGANNQIMLVDYMGVGRQKPNFLNNF